MASRSRRAPRLARSCVRARPEATPGPTPEPNLDLVPVFRTGDAGFIALAKSLLDGEGIDYLARGDGLQDLFGCGRLGVGFSYVVGPVEFVVRSDDAPRVRAVLADLATLQKELALVGASGYQLVGMTVGKTALGGNELVAITRRVREQ